MDTTSTAPAASATSTDPTLEFLLDKMNRPAPAPQSASERSDWQADGRRQGSQRENTDQSAHVFVHHNKDWLLQDGKDGQLSPSGQRFIDYVQEAAQLVGSTDEAVAMTLRRMKAEGHFNKQDIQPTNAQPATPQDSMTKLAEEVRPGEDGWSFMRRALKR